MVVDCVGAGAVAVPATVALAEGAPLATAVTDGTTLGIAVSAGTAFEGTLSQAPMRNTALSSSRSR